MSILLDIIKDIVGAKKRQRTSAPVAEAKDDSERLVPAFLNVGGGSKMIPVPEHFAGWEHVLLDINPTTGADVICDARELVCFEPAQWDAIYCSHNLEHYYRHDVRRVLKGFLHVLKENGFAEIRVPDFAGVLDQVFEKKLSLQSVLYQSPVGPITVHDVIWGYGKEIEESGVDFYAHKTGFAQKDLAEILLEAGFESVIELQPGMLELHVAAFKKPPTESQLSFFGKQVNNIG